jgi:hypothetical protein
VRVEELASLKLWIAHLLGRVIPLLSLLTPGPDRRRDRRIPSRGSTAEVATANLDASALLTRWK